MFGDVQRVPNDLKSTVEHMSKRFMEEIRMDQ